MLDRDGTIIADKDYLCDPAGVELLPGAARGLRRLSRAGLGLVVISNQSGVGRGMFRREDVERVNARMEALLAEQGVELDGIYYCPHAPGAGCRCRKPATGLVERAARDLGFNPAEGFVLGDYASDLELGRRLGARTILLRTGYGRETEESSGGLANLVADDLNAAATWIIAALRRVKRDRSDTQRTRRRP
jgi:D-glycero-D-manno-heptose 1,7-bisphosphate phosphatase